MVFVSRQIARLQASFDKSVAEKEELTHNIEQTQGRLTRAGKLTTGLADEQIRWAESVKVWSYKGGRGLIIIVLLCRFRNSKKRLVTWWVMFLWLQPAWLTMEPSLHHTETG